MTDLEAIQFIEDVLGGYWSEWQFTKFETAAWIERLRSFDSNHAKKAVKKFYFEQKTERKKPAAGRLIVALAEEALIEKKQSIAGAVQRFLIIRADGRRRWHAFTTSIDLPVEVVDRLAEKICNYANLMETGNYIQHLDGSSEELTGYSGDEDKTINERRAQARDKAFVDILGGPDNKTRAWLESYLLKKWDEDQPPVSGSSKIGESVRI